MIKRRDPQIIAMDNLSLGYLNTLALKHKHGAEVMDNIPLCATCGAVPWTNDLLRHQKAVLRGATPDVLVCDTCFKGVKVANESGT